MKEKFKKGWKKKELSGTKVVKISNISCFVNYKVDPIQNICKLKIYTRIRPGYIKKTFEVDQATFDIDKELKFLKFEIASHWDGSMKPKAQEGAPVTSFLKMNTQIAFNEDVSIEIVTSESEAAAADANILEIVKNFKT